MNVLDNGDALRRLLAETLRATRDKGAALSKGELTLTPVKMNEVHSLQSGFA